MKQFGDTIMVGLRPGVVVGMEKKRKWVYYFVVFQGADLTCNDWHDYLIEYDVIREDKLS
jgi:hypothetical protein